MISIARSSARGSFLLSLFVLCGLAWMSGCGKEEPAPFHNPTGNNTDRDSGPDEPRDGGSVGGGGSGGSSGSGGSGGSGTGGDGGTIELSDSPTNPWIAFSELDESGFGQLFFIKADGTGLHEYGGDSFSETDAAWSPDGQRLAVSAIDLEDGAQLHVLDFESGTDDVLDTGLGTVARPRWSPDGAQIVVAGASEAGQPSALYRVDATEGGSEPITEPIEGDGGHDVAADGTVYFVRKRSDSSFDIYSIASTGSPIDDPSRVTTGSGVLGGVEIHPDGSKLVYARAAMMGSTQTTNLIELTLGGDDRVIGQTGDEQPDYYSGGDFMVLKRGAQIVLANSDADLVMACTSGAQIKTNPAVSSIESADVDVTQF